MASLMESSVRMPDAGVISVCFIVKYQLILLAKSYGVRKELSIWQRTAHGKQTLIERTGFKEITLTIDIKMNQCWVMY